MGSKSVACQSGNISHFCTAKGAVAGVVAGVVAGTMAGAMANVAGWLEEGAMGAFAGAVQAETRGSNTSA